MSHMLRDCWRTWRKAPVVTLVTIASLALGIGTANAFFAIVDQLLFRTLRIDRPHELYQLSDDDAIARRRPRGYTYRAWEALRDQTAVFEVAFARKTTEVDLATTGESDPASAVWVSGDAFRALGVGAFRGRVLAASDDVIGGGPHGPAAVVSHRFWKRRFGGSDDAVGRSLTVGGVPFTVVGVASESFEGFEVGRPFDLVLPMATEPLVSGASSFVTTRAGGAMLDVFVRLRPGLEVAAATDALRRAQPAIRQETMPNYRQARDREAYLRAPFVLTPAPQGGSLPARYYSRPLMLVLGLALLVLVAVCGNVAAVLLAQGEGRRYEFAVRLALGTSRRQLAAQVVTDGLLLAATGAGCGLVLAWWLAPVLLARLSGMGVPIDFATPLDWRGVWAAVVAALFTGLLCSVAPLLAAKDVDAAAALANRTPGRAHTARLGRLVSAQLAFSTMIVASAALLWASHRGLVQDGTGVHAPDTIAVEMHLDRVDDDVAVRGMEQLRARVAALPGVERAALAQTVPLQGFYMTTIVSSEQSDAMPERDRVVQFQWTSPGYLAAMGTALLAGRDFADSDSFGRPAVAIVNTALIDKFFAGDRSLPKRLVRPTDDGGAEELSIIGIAENVQFKMLGEEAMPALYVAASQQPHRLDRLRSAVLVVRPQPGTAIGPALAALLAREQVPFAFTTRPFSYFVDRNTAQTRLLAECAGAFALVAVVMAAIGMFGAAVHWTTRRRRELGVRLAVGAVPGDIVTLVLRQATWRAVCGVVPGMIGAWWILRAASSWVMGAQPEVQPLVVSGLGLIGILLLATAWPATRAGRMAPADVLRAE